jgi:hypothetical protein
MSDATDDARSYGQTGDASWPAVEDVGAPERRRGVAELFSAVDRLHGEVTGMRREVRQLGDDVSGMVEVWQTGAGVVRFLRWTAKVLGYLSVIGGGAFWAWRTLKHSLGLGIES